MHFVKICHGDSFCRSWGLHWRQSPSWGCQTEGMHRLSQGQKINENWKALVYATEEQIILPSFLRFKGKIKGITHKIWWRCIWICQRCTVKILRRNFNPKTKISMDRFSCLKELINQTVFILMTLKDSTVLLCLYLPDPAAFIASESVLGNYISFAEGLFIQLWK